MTRPFIGAQSDKREHVNGCFKHIESFISAYMVKTEPGITARHILAKGFALVVNTAAVGMAWDTLLICPYKDAVVITGILVEHSGMDEVVYHFWRKTAMLCQVCKHALAVTMCRWQYELSWTPYAVNDIYWITSPRLTP